jgi:hypothetical protein
MKTERRKQRGGWSRREQKLLEREKLAKRLMRKLLTKEDKKGTSCNITGHIFRPLGSLHQVNRNLKLGDRSLGKIIYFFYFFYLPNSLEII